MTESDNANQPAPALEQNQPAPERASTVSTKPSAGTTRVTVGSDSNAVYLKASGSAADSWESCTHVRAKDTDGNSVIMMKGAAVKLGLIGADGKSTRQTIFGDRAPEPWSPHPGTQQQQEQPNTPQSGAPTPEMIAARADVQRQQQIAQNTNALIPPQLAAAYINAGQALGQHNVEMIESRVLAALHASATGKGAPDAFDPAQLAHATGKTVEQIAPHVRAIAARVALPLKAVAEKLGMQPQEFFAKASEADGGEALSVAAHAMIKGDPSKLMALARGMAQTRVTSTKTALEQAIAAGAKAYQTNTPGKLILVMPNGSRQFVQL